MLLVLVRSGPARSYAHIRLPTLPSSADGAITFSHGHFFGLAVLDLGARSIVPSLHAHTHYIQPVLITSRTATKRHIQILHDYSILVPCRRSRNIPKVILVRRWAVGVLGIWRGGESWVKGGANGVSLQAT